MCFEPMTSVLDTFVIKVFVVPRVIFVVRVHQLVELSLGEDWLLLVVDKVEGPLINVSDWFDIFQFQTCNVFSLLYPNFLSLNPCDTTSGKSSKRFGCLGRNDLDLLITKLVLFGGLSATAKHLL